MKGLKCINSKPAKTKSRMGVRRHRVCSNQQDVGLTNNHFNENNKIHTKILMKKSNNSCPRIHIALIYTNFNL